MNIFYLSKDFNEAAEMHLDKHVVKMILEYAQLLSTCHRVLDGEMYLDKTKNNRNIKRWKHPDEIMENNLYKASHINHPCNVWVRESIYNYYWLFKLWRKLCMEYTHRYGKIHLTQKKLHKYLARYPINIQKKRLTQLPQAMPDDVKATDSVVAYRNYYKVYKKHMGVWTKREKPFWFHTV